MNYGPLVLGWFVFINLVAFTAYASDKTRSIRGTTRIPERNLLILAAIGGSVGAVAARVHFRHKTRKQPFADMLLLTVGLQLGATFGMCVLVLMMQPAVV